MEAKLIEWGLWDQVVMEVDEKEKSIDQIEADKARVVAKRTAKKMGEARARMIAQVETSQLVHMHKRDPMAIWSSLAMTHRARGLATCLAKWQRFLMAAKEPEESITAWTSRVKSMAFDLEDLGGSVTSEDLIVVLTMGLGTEYDYFVASIDATVGKELNVEHVVTHMLNEEACHAIGGAMPANTALAATVTPRNPPKTRKCWWCGGTDHLRSECNVLDDVECNKCGSEGHLAKACYKRGGGMKGKLKGDGGLQAMSATLGGPYAF